MDFDHIPGRGEKFFTLNRINGTLSRKMASIVAEVQKCEVVCANCHRVRTKQRVRAAKLIAQEV